MAQSRANRRRYTKLDWILWTATLTQNQDDFRALVEPVNRFLVETPDLAPLTDWYQTDTGRKIGFTARPVVGGVFLQLLYNNAVWTKWAKRDQTAADNYRSNADALRAHCTRPVADTSPTTWRFGTRPVSNRRFRQILSAQLMLDERQSRAIFRRILEDKKAALRTYDVVLWRFEVTGIKAVALFER